MRAQEWLVLAALIVLACGVFLGMRGGRRQFKAHTAATFASGEAAAEAALSARLSQHVTVVAGNREYGRSDREGGEPAGVSYGVHRDLSLSSLAAEQGLDLERVRRMGLEPGDVSDAAVDRLLAFMRREEISESTHPEIAEYARDL